MSDYKVNTNVQKCFKLLIYLHEHGITKSSELEKILDVKERHLRRYIYALRATGINIRSKAGKDGGYYIDEDKCPLCQKSWI